DDRPAGERRVRVDLLARDALAPTAPGGEPRRVVDQGDDPDEADPEGEADMARARAGLGGVDLHDDASIGFERCATSRLTRRTPSSSTCGRWSSSWSRTGRS